MHHVADSASLGEGCELGHFSVVGERARIGRGCVIGHHVVIGEGCRIEDGVRIDDHAVIGKQPMRAANSATTRERSLPPVEIGANSLIGTGAIIYAGARIGGNVLVADLVTVREDVTIGDYPWVLEIQYYSTATDLLESFLESVVEPAEAKARDLSGA